MSGETAQVPGAVILTTVCTAPAQRIAACKTPRFRTGNCVVCDLYLGRYISRLQACVPRCSTFSDLLAHDFSTQTAVALCCCQPRSRTGDRPFGWYRCKWLPCGQQNRSAPLPHAAPAARTEATTASSPRASSCTGSRPRSGACASPSAGSCARARSSAGSGARTCTIAMRRRYGCLRDRR